MQHYIYNILVIKFQIDDLRQIQIRNSLITKSIFQETLNNLKVNAIYIIKRY